MKEVVLGNICDVVRGSSPRPKGDPRFYGGKIPRLMVSDLTRDGMYVTPKIDSLTEEGAKKSRPMKKGDVIIAVSGNPGEPCILNINACIHDGFVGLRNLDETLVYVPFFYQYLKYIKEKNKAQAVGAIYKNLNTAQIKALKIPLPPLPQQKRIAAILDKADELKRHSQTIIDKYDELTQSLFLDMFGDPVVNPMGWEVKKLSDVCNKITDGTHDTPKRLTEGVKFITGKHIRPFKIDYNNSDYVTKEVHDEIYKRCNPEKEDVLYTNIGVNLGTAAMNTVDYPFSMKNVALLKQKREFLHGRYIEHFLNSERMKSKIIWIASIGGAQKFLSLTQIRKLTILLPPLPLQTQFAERVKAIEQQKQAAQESLKKAEDLFNGLLQQAFKGELR